MLEELRSFAQAQRENSQQRWQLSSRSALDILDGLWCLAPETRNGELIAEPDAHFTYAACLESIVEHECDATDPDGLTMGRLHEAYKQCKGQCGARGGSKADDI
jgi:hypothetical protein